MKPSYNDKSLVVYDRNVKDLNNYERGSVIIFRKDNVNYVKRILGVEGDSLKIEDGKFYINDNYVCDGGKNNLGSLNFTHIPKGYVFCIGDNRNNSIDSRDKDFGLVNLNSEAMGLVLN